LENSYSERGQNFNRAEQPASADELLRLYRQRSALTQSQLAGLLGFTNERMIRKWEGNFALPGPDRLKSLIELYLTRRVFVQGQELLEASKLWLAVKNSYEVRGLKPKAYPNFSKSWFNNLPTPGPILIYDTPDLNKKPPQPNHNFVLPATSFVGRKTELQQIKTLLRKTRLLTIAGPGGIGKTRLALQAGQELLNEFRDGIWLLELAALRNAEQITRTLATVLGVKEATGQPLIETIVSYLKPKELLVILDNCEQFIADCAAFVAKLMSFCPDLKIMVTSRERLKVTGEVVWRVPALSLPQRLSQFQETGEDHLEEIRAADAVELFIDRATAVQPSFNLNIHNMQAVIELCHHLDGLPLAIELAAARTRILSIEQIFNRLSERFSLLTSPNKIGVSRQKSLQALIDWSFELLSNKEQKTLARLAVFAGDFTLEAAEVVCSGTNGESEVYPAEFLGLLSELVAKSLVSTRRMPEIFRYNLLETIRLYAQEKLKATDNEKRWRERHLEYYMSSVARNQPGIIWDSQRVYLELVEKDYPNFRAALNYAIDEQKTSLALQLCNNLFSYWELKAFYTEAKSFLERCLAIPVSCNKIERAQSLINLSRLAELQGNNEDGVRLATQGLEIGQEIANDGIISKSLHSLGNLQIWLGNYDAARENHTQVLSLLQGSGDELGIASTFSSLGLLASFQSDYPAASRFYLQALIITRQLGDYLATANNLSFLGINSLNQGSYDEAGTYFEECLAIARQMDNRRIIAGNLTNLGIVAFYLGKYQKAQALYTESLALHIAIGNNPHASNVLINLGELHKIQGSYEKAQDYTLQALKLKNEMSDKWGIAICLNNLGNIATNLSDYAKAREYCLESLTIREALDNKNGIASCFNNLGTIDLLEGKFGSANNFYRQSLDLQRQLKDASGIIKLLANLGLVSVLEGKTEKAENYLLEISQLNPLAHNHQLLASIFAILVILNSEQRGKEKDCAFLVKVVEALLIQSGGVLEKAYLQPYLKAREKFWVEPEQGQAKVELDPQFDLAELLKSALRSGL
jgi:predicted ATPase/Flp pilus assembly protein TadD/transcriptional regulator with XRE-family HTH domain